MEPKLRRERAIRQLMRGSLLAEIAIAERLRQGDLLAYLAALGGLPARLRELVEESDRLVGCDDGAFVPPGFPPDDGAPPLAN